MVRLAYIIAIVAIVIDQITKGLIVKNMLIGERITIINNFLYITSHRNRGAAWGILQGKMIFFYIITLIVIAALIYYIHRYTNNQKLLLTSLGLILGGAIGNFIDRLFRKEVVDFIDVIIFTYDYPIFNIADSALVVGVGLLVIYTLFFEKKKEVSTRGNIDGNG